MSDSTESPDPAEGAPVIERPRRRFSSVWIVPILAAILGLWLVYQHYSATGPSATILFETAEGVVAGKTSVQCRSITVGMVDSVRLTEDRTGVIVKVQFDASAADLVVEDSRFWVVRARFGGGTVSGLGTLVSGAFIELDPGTSEKRSRSFEGLENPPVTPLNVPGLRLSLLAERAGSLGPGAPISYRGIAVGRIESREFDPDSGSIEFGAFVDEKYASVVTRNTRFWNASGLSVDVSADGFRVRTGSLQSLVAGGVEFDIPGGQPRMEPAENGAAFHLYEDIRAVEEDVSGFNPTLTYLLLFEDSVRGLKALAPVEYRGIRVGTVGGVSFDYLPGGTADRRVPVLIQVDPDLIAHGSGAPTEDADEVMATYVRDGLRASLKTGSLITGALFVDLNFVEDADPAEVVDVGGYRVLPTSSSGLARIEDKLVQVLDKLQNLALEETIASATGALDEIRSTATEAKAAVADLKGASASLDALLSAEDTRALPEDVRATLASLRETLDGFNENSAVYNDLTVTLQDLRSTLRSVESLAGSLEKRPNSIIFGRPGGNPEPPRAKR